MADFATLGLRIKNNQFNRGVDQSIGKLGALGGIAKTAGLAIGAVFGARAVLNFAKDAVRAYGVQEMAINKLNSALASNGDNVQRLSPIFQEFAKNVQDQTVFGDEYTLGLMAQIRNLGILPNQMEKATKGAIGLSKALGLDANSSARYTALALQGEYTILQRYVPALRTATSEAEKQAIVTDLMTKGYQQAQAETNTYEGQLKQLTNTWGDLKELIGSLLLDLFDVKGGMKSLNETLQEQMQYLKTNGDSWVYYAKVAFIEVQFLGQKVMAVFDLVSGNIGTQLGWIWANWDKLWNNAGAIFEAWAIDQFNVFKNFNQGLFNLFANSWEAIKAIFSGGDISGALSNIFNTAVNDFVKTIGDAGRETEKALEKAGITKLELKGFDDLLGDFAEIDKAKANALKELFEKTQARAGALDQGTGATGPGTAPAQASTAKALVENTLVDAIEKGSLNALKLESRTVTKEDKIENNTKKTAKNTETIASELVKLNKKTTTASTEEEDVFQD